MLVVAMGRQGMTRNKKEVSHQGFVRRSTRDKSPFHPESPSSEKSRYMGYSAMLMASRLRELGAASHACSSRACDAGYTRARAGFRRWCS